MGVGEKAADAVTLTSCHGTPVLGSEVPVVPQLPSCSLQTGSRTGAVLAARCGPSEAKGDGDTPHPPMTKSRDAHTSDTLDPKARFAGNVKKEPPRPGGRAALRFCV